MKLKLLIILLILIFPTLTLARYTPNDAYKDQMAAFEKSLSNLKDPEKKAKVQKAVTLLDQTNKKVVLRFESDMNKLGAIMEEVKARQGVTETRVAYGGVSSGIENADYWVNWAAEALAYQKAQNYIPQFSSDSSVDSSIKESTNILENNLNTLAGKILRAKSEVKKVLNEK